MADLPPPRLQDELNSQAWKTRCPLCPSPAALDQGRYARFEEFLLKAGLIDKIEAVSDILDRPWRATMSYGRTFTEWRAQAPDWDAYTRHPFVQGMADGSLPRDAFLNYLVQDYLFLIHFARAWALAVVKAGDLDEMRACSAVVHTLIDHEMALHVETCAAAGIDTRMRCWQRPRR